MECLLLQFGVSSSALPATLEHLLAVLKPLRTSCGFKSLARLLAVLLTRSVLAHACPSSSSSDDEEAGLLSQEGTPAELPASGNAADDDGGPMGGAGAGASTSVHQTDATTAALAPSRNREGQPASSAAAEGAASLASGRSAEGRPMRVLEVGFGTGPNLPFYREYGPDDLEVGSPPCPVL